MLFGEPKACMREQQLCCSFLLTDKLCMRELRLRLWRCPGHGTAWVLRWQGQGIKGVKGIQSASRKRTTATP